MTKLTIPALALAALAAGLAAQPAIAGEPAAPTVEIRLAPRMLVGSDNGIRTRIIAAASKVCRAEGTGAAARMAAQDCRQRAVRAAEAQLVALRQTARGAQQALVTVDGPKVR